MSKRSIGVMAVAMLLIVGMIIPAVADNDTGVYPPGPDVTLYTGQGMTEEGPSTETCDPFDTGQYPSDGFDEESGYLHWILTATDADYATLYGPWGSINLVQSSSDKGAWHGATVYYSLADLLDGSVYAEHNGTGTVQLTVSNGCPGVPDDITKTVVFTKNWIGHPFDASSLLVTFDVEVDGTVGTYGNGEVIYYEDDYSFVSENVSGFPEDVCSWEFDSEVAASSTTPEGDTAASFDITNKVTCDDEENGDDSITITLVKEWYDAEGNILVGAPGVGVQWDLFMTSQPDEDNLGREWEFFEAGERYGVQEISADGYEAVPCGGLTTTDAVAYNTSEVSVALGAEDGTFGATDSGVHVVCNQAVEEQVEEPVVTLTVTKDWVGTEDDLDGVTATLFINEEEVEWGTAVEVDAGSTVTLSEDVDGLDEDLCSWEGTLPETFVVPTGQLVDTNYLVEAVNVVACDDDRQTIIEREIERATPVPTRIDSGTGGLLPDSNPAALLLLMLGGLALTGGAAASLVRRRG